MNMWKKLAGGVAFAAMSSVLVQPATAQVTTSGVQGTVSNADGTPAANATVTVVDTRNGFSRTSSTNSTGSFEVRNLSVGGPYTVSVEAPDQQPARVEDVFLTLGGATALNLKFSGAVARDIVVVSATASGATQLAIGPSSSFNLATLESSPAINRDIRDIIRLDPRIYLDPTNSGAIQCGGANPRYNALTVDGVRMADSFGLNSSGYPTERIPFSYDAIQQVAVELAPFDVGYGGFSACNINAVTKSGGNTFHGGLFYDFTNDGLTGDSVKGNSVDLGKFDEKRYGVNIGGPIIADRLFFFAAYEKLEGTNTFFRGPVGSGAGNEIANFTQAQYDRILQITRDVYGYEPGGILSSAPNEDEKFLAKIDWNINDRHRASFTYTYNDGYNIAESDLSATKFEYSNHYYERGAKLESYAGSVFSDWTDNFSTEARVTYLKLVNRQISLAGTEFGEVQIQGDNNTIYFGSDDSRYANQLNYDALNIRLRGDYRVGDHLFTAGIERETLDVFNLFGQDSQGEYTFGSTRGTLDDAIDAYEAGNPAQIVLKNAATLDINDAAAKFGYSVNTVYGQDKFNLTDALTLTLGLRYDWYQTSDKPAKNAAFESKFGFSNDSTLDGEGLLQPRIGFQLDATDDIALRGGIGVFSGGNPNVWLSNNYSNDGVTYIETRDNDIGLGSYCLFASATCPNAFTFVNDESGTGRPIYGQPQELLTAIQSGGRLGSINLLDPNFELPYNIKYALGATAHVDVPMLGGDYVVNGDVILTASKKPPAVRQIGIQAIDDGPAGFHYLDDVNGEAYMLTNGDGFSSSTVSVSVNKDYDFGLSWGLGYAYSEANDNSPMTSSVAFSNFTNVAYVDPNNLPSAQSNYNTRNRFTLQATYAKAFFGDYETRVSLFGQASEGQPYSYTFATNSVTGFFESGGGTLLYVPTGPSDPNVVFGSSFDQAGFFNYLKTHDLERYAGRFSPRNGFNSDWWSTVDLKLEQELPGFLPGHKSSAFLVVQNLTNLLNDEWGVLRESSFPHVTPIVTGSYNQTTNQFNFTRFNNVNAQPVNVSPSLWSVRVGVKYDF
jgi:outer membrane receptor for ferrienterochelin and colicin